MERKIKCTNCGKSNFSIFCFSFKTGCCECIGTEHEAYNENIEPYACEECGRIELFSNKSNQQTLYEEAQFEKEKLEHASKTEQIKKEKSSLEKQINELKKLVNDDNQTVKVVNEAKQQLDKLEKRLHGLSAEPCSKNPWEM